MLSTVFAPQALPDEAAHRSLIARAANAALRGETHNAGRFTLPAGQSSLSVRDARFGAGRLALLVPLNQAASALPWWQEAMSRGQAVFSFGAAPATDAEFGYAVLGVGNPDPHNTAV
jgi:hypothetical protein